MRSLMFGPLVETNRVFKLIRFIVVYFPLKRRELCSAQRNKKVIVFLVIFSAILYSYGFWTSTLKLESSGTKPEHVCVTIDEWLGLLKVMAIVDSFLTMFIPFVLILTLNVLIIIKLTRKKSFCKKQKDRSKSEGADSSLLSDSTSSQQQPAKSILRHSVAATHHASQGVVALAKKSDSLPMSNENSGERKKNAIPNGIAKDQGSSHFLNLLSFDSASRRSSARSNSGEAGGNAFGRSEKCMRRRNASTTTVMTISTFSNLRTSGRDSSYQTRVIRFLSNAENMDIQTIRRQAKQNSKTTRILLIISTTFLILHGPTAFLKLWYTLMTNFQSSHSSNGVAISADQPVTMATNDSSNSINHTYSFSANEADREALPFEELLERITCLLYYLHYCLNFFLYVMNIKMFREFFLRTRH